MTLMYPWLLFFLAPLYFLYRQQHNFFDKHKKQQRDLLYLSLLFMLLALSRPVLINTLQEQKFDAQDYIIALDASYSMQADDLKPSRYDLAKKSIASIVKKLNTDRFSIFAFTTNAMLISPPTTDSTISLEALNTLEPKYILTKGTSLLSLFKSIAKTSYHHKKLLIFSDGGEDQDLAQLVSLCKKHTITPYIVATASSQGSTLKKGDKPIIDDKKNLVVSRINPLLKPLSQECGGRYYELNSLKDLSTQIISDLHEDKQSINIKTKVLRYSELYYLPLFLALITFFIAVTRFHQLYLILVLLFIPYPSHASALMDYYKNNRALHAYAEHDYLKSAQDFQEMAPSLYSYYNSATAYYKAQHYKKAIALFSKIKSPDKTIKQKLYYNMGNCAVQLKKYERAKRYYRQALQLGVDEDALHNLALLYKLGLKEQEDLSAKMPKRQKQATKQQKKADSKDQEKEKKSSSGSGSGQQASQKHAGSGQNKKKKQQQQDLKLSKKESKSDYKLGYKAYELINKGYTNEIHPW